MLTTAAWELADLVGDGLVSTAQAKDVLAYVVARVMVDDKNPNRAKIR